jgi:hypothetical protein
MGVFNKKEGIFCVVVVVVVMADREDFVVMGNLFVSFTCLHIKSP